MKRIILSVMVMAFAVAVQAGDGKTCQDKDKAGCCASKVKTSLQAGASQDSDKASCCSSKVKTSLEAGTSQDKGMGDSDCCASKVKTSVEAKGSCPFAKGACSKQTVAKQTASRQVVLLSPKAASLASN